MKPFKHFDAATIEAGAALLEKYHGRARLIAGGTDLLGALKDRIYPEYNGDVTRDTAQPMALKGRTCPDYPEALVNLKTVPGLDGLREEDGRLTIGALTRLADLAAAPVVKEHYGALADAAASVATPVIRKMATIGGNLCQDVRCWYYRYPHSLGGRIDCYRKGGPKCPAVPGDNRYHAIMNGKVCFAVCPSDTAVALTALEAEIVVAGPGGRRTVPLDAFYTATGHILTPDEIVTEVRVPRPPSGTRQTFLKFTLRQPIDFALASVAAVITVQDGVCVRARIALGAVAPMPVAVEAEAALTGRTINEASAQAVAEEAMAKAKPLSLNAYKVDIVKALIKKALLS